MGIRWRCKGNLLPHIFGKIKVTAISPAEGNGGSGPDLPTRSFAKTHKEDRKTDAHVRVALSDVGKFAMNETSSVSSESATFTYAERRNPLDHDSTSVFPSPTRILNACTGGEGIVVDCRQSRSSNNAEGSPNGQLFRGIVRHRVAWVQEADAGRVVVAGDHKSVVDAIEW